MSEEKEIDKLIPSMNLSLPQKQEEEKEMITDEALMGMYGEIVGYLRNDRTQLDDILANFVEMVINEGDATAASKEALVNLFKIKTEIPEKMTKIADLMTRLKMKEKNTMPAYLAAKQENNINIGNSGKRALLKEIEKMQKLQQKKKKEEPSE